MNIEWDAPPSRSRRNSSSGNGLWSKIRNNLSVIRPVSPDNVPSQRSPPRQRRHSVTSGGAPAPISRSASTPPVRPAASGSASRASAVAYAAATNVPPSARRNNITHSSRPPVSGVRPSSGYATDSYSATRQPRRSSTTGTVSSSSRTASSKPVVTVHTSGAPVQMIYPVQQANGITTYVVAPPPPQVGSYAPAQSSPLSPPGYSSAPYGSRPAAPTPLRRNSYQPSALAKGTSTSNSYSNSNKTTTPPAAAPSTSQESRMYNGKLIQGTKENVDRYISSQQRIENWIGQVYDATSRP